MRAFLTKPEFEFLLILAFIAGLCFGLAASLPTENATVAHADLAREDAATGNYIHDSLAG